MKSKDEVIRAKDEVIRIKDDAAKKVLQAREEKMLLIEKDVMRLENELLTQQAKYENVCTMRPLIEHALYSLPHSTMSSKVEAFVHNSIMSNERTLQLQVENWITDLEGSCDKASIKN